MMNPIWWVVITLGIFLIYWIGVRPAMVIKEANKIALKVSLETKEGETNPLKVYELNYKMQCRARGYDPR